MNYLAVFLAIQLAAPPMEVASPPDATREEVGEAPASEEAEAVPSEASAPTSEASQPEVEVATPLAATGEQPIEGPQPAPAVGEPGDWWHRRDRRLRDATIGLGAVTGAAFLASGLFLIGSYKTRGAATTTDAGALGSAIVGFIALPALIGVGTAYGVSHRRGWEPQPAAPKFDPRNDPFWAARDRNLRNATIALGVTTGVLGISIPISLAIGARVISTPDCSGQGDCQDPIASGIGLAILVIVEAALTGASLTALAGVGGAWAGHRRSLRRWQTSISPGGLMIRF